MLEALGRCIDKRHLILGAAIKEKRRAKTLSAIAIAFREDTKPFDKTDGVFNKDTFS